MRRLGLALVAILGALVLMPACSTHVAFKQDHRLQFVYPRDRQKVTLPMTVRWTIDDFHVTGPTPTTLPKAGYFAVFVDRSPQPPGEALTWFARNDRSCKRTPTCPDTAYFNRHDIYTTTDTTFALNVVKAPPSGSKGKDVHDVTVVLLDGTGRRIGETAFNVSFEVPRQKY